MVTAKMAIDYPQNVPTLLDVISIPWVHIVRQDNKHAYSHQIGLLDMPTNLTFPPREQILNHPLMLGISGVLGNPWFDGWLSCFETNSRNIISF